MAAVAVRMAPTKMVRATAMADPQSVTSGPHYAAKAGADVLPLTRRSLIAGASALLLSGAGLAWADHVSTRRSVVYWTAKDCAVCKSWERIKKKPFLRNLDRAGIRFITVEKNSTRDQWAVNDKDHPFLAEMISASTAPMVLPAFSWFYQEEEIVRDIGWKYEKWDSHSAQRIKELLSLTE